jgi:hypothetical protein
MLRGQDDVGKTTSETEQAMMADLGDDDDDDDDGKCSVLVRFQVLTATSMKMTVLWGVAPCSVGRLL